MRESTSAGGRAVLAAVFSAVLWIQPPAPSVDLTLTLRDHNFKLTAPIQSGRSTWLVRNAGTERHQALVVRLGDGMSEWTLRNWVTNGSRGDRPGHTVADVRLDAGRETRTVVNLAPGQYVLLCTMKEDEGYHFDLGMIYRFTIE